MSEIVHITDKAEQRLSSYLRQAEGEISGFGLVRKDGDLLVVHEIFILEQESGGAHTVLDTDAMQNLLYTLLQKGVGPEEVTLWWHSHGSGSAFFSDVDDDTIDRFAEFGRPWMLSLVSNRSLQHRLRVDFYDPIRATIEDVELRQFSRIDVNFDRKVAAEIARKVRKPIPVPQQHGGYNWWDFPPTNGRKHDPAWQQKMKQLEEGDELDREIEQMMRQAPGAVLVGDD